MPKPSRFWRRHCMALSYLSYLSWHLDCRNSKTTSLRPISFNLDSHPTFKPFKHQLYPKVLYNVSVHITLKNWEARQQRPPSESAPETLQDCWHGKQWSACSGKCSTDVCSCTASNYLPSPHFLNKSLRYCCPFSWKQLWWLGRPHTCSEISYRITDVECIGRAQTIP